MKVFVGSAEWDRLCQAMARKGILVPKPDGSTEVKFISSARLRCSAQAAINLRNALDTALKMLEQPQGNMAAIAAGKLN